MFIPMELYQLIASSMLLSTKLCCISPVSRPLYTWG